MSAWARERLRIAVVADELAEKMGYAENCLPRALAGHGHDVQVFASNAQVYSGEKLYHQIYEPFLGTALVPCGTKQKDGYTLHRFPYRRLWRRIRYIEGLRGALSSFKPQIVQTFDCISLTTLLCASLAPKLEFSLFTGNHTVASVYPAATRYSKMGLLSRARIRLADTLPGCVAARNVTRCYAATVDAADIAIRFFGVPSVKVSVLPLGVDTAHFRPAVGDQDERDREALRRKLGFEEDEIVCVYTGRFTPAKGPLILGRVIASLPRDGKLRALFVGSGPQAAELSELRNCTVIPFVHFTDLAALYRAGDIGVWPRQESTSMLDAAATGLPVVISNLVKATERVEGNGLTYEEGSPQDLVRALQALTSLEYRRTLGQAGAEKIRRHYSWRAIAEQRLADYQAALA